MHVTDHSKNAPISNDQNILVGPLGRGVKKRRYTKSKYIEDLAISTFHRTELGITFKDLLIKKYAFKKKQAQNTLKKCLQNKILFTIEDRKPQQYYATSIKSEIIKKKQKNILVGHTEDNNSNHQYPWKKKRKDIDISRYDELILQTLEGYVLPLLPKTELQIHKLHFKLFISGSYHELDLPTYKNNHGKVSEQRIGSRNIKYIFYSNGRVMVYIKCSNNSFRLEHEDDLSIFFSFLGQVRDRLIMLLNDVSERLVPSIMEWKLTQCDINKDVVIDDQLSIINLNIQIKHIAQVFRIYLKTTGKNTLWRAEKSKNFNNVSVVEGMNNLLNPFISLNDRFDQVLNKLDKILKLLGDNKN